MMWLLLTAQANTMDLWDRCIEQRTATADQAEQGRTLQRQAFRQPFLARPGLDGLASDIPDCATVYMVRASASHAIGEDRAALDDLVRAESLASWPEILRAVAVAADKHGDPSKLERAVRSNPRDTDLRLRWIQTLRPSEQTRQFREALTMHNRDPQLVQYALQSLADGGYKLESLERARALVDKHPQLQHWIDSTDKQFAGPAEPRERRPAEVRILDDGTEEVIVYSPAKARERLTERLEELGWTESKSVRGGTKYLSTGTRPFVVVYDNGEIDVQKSGFVQTAKADDALRVGRTGVDLGGGTGLTVGGRISKRKMAQKRGAVMEDIWLEVTEWRQARDRVVFQGAIMEDLPDKLEALWKGGTPIYGDAVLTTPAAKRAALLEHWSSRACSDAGEAVRGVLSTFLQLEVNESATPLTAEEIEAAEATNPCGSKLFPG